MFLGLMAAAAHDVDHPGVNQPFLIKTRHHLASLYQVYLACCVSVCEFVMPESRQDISMAKIDGVTHQRLESIASVVCAKCNKSLTLRSLFSHLVRCECLHEPELALAAYCPVMCRTHLCWRAITGGPRLACCESLDCCHTFLLTYRKNTHTHLHAAQETAFLDGY